MGKVYVMECAINELALVSTSGKEIHDQQSSSSSVWHARLGHLTTRKIEALQHCVDGFKMKSMSKRERDEEVICEGCINGISFVHPFPKSPYVRSSTYT